MKHKITTAYNDALDSYETVLDKYGATYHTEESYSNDHYAMIELKSVSDLKKLAKELEQSIVVSDYDDSLIIYDDYME